MRTDGLDSINTNIGINSGNTVTRDISTRNTGSDQIDGLKKALTITKNVSQLNEYDKDSLPVSERVVIEAIQKANKAISGGNRRFEFSIHEKTNEIVVKVFDSDTNELVREIPNEKVLDMVARICEMAGILVDERR